MSLEIFLEFFINVTAKRPNACTNFCISVDFYYLAVLPSDYKYSFPWWRTRCVFIRDPVLLVLPVDRGIFNDELKTNRMQRTFHQPADIYGNCNCAISDVAPWLSKLPSISTLCLKTRRIIFYLEKRFLPFRLTEIRVNGVTRYRAGQLSYIHSNRPISRLSSRFVKSKLKRDITRF